MECNKKLFTEERLPQGSVKKTPKWSFALWQHWWACQQQDKQCCITSMKYCLLTTDININVARHQYVQCRLMPHKFGSLQQQMVVQPANIRLQATAPMFCQQILSITNDDTSVCQPASCQKHSHRWNALDWNQRTKASNAKVLHYICKEMHSFTWWLGLEFCVNLILLCNSTHRIQTSGNADDIQQSLAAIVQIPNRLNKQSEWSKNPSTQHTITEHVTPCHSPHNPMPLNMSQCPTEHATQLPLNMQKCLQTCNIKSVNLQHCHLLTMTLAQAKS